MPGFRALDRWKKGDPITAERLNELVEACRLILNITGAPPIEVGHSDSGMTVSLGANIPRLDLIELDEDCEAGKLDKEASTIVRDYGASPSDADQFDATTETLTRFGDHMRSLWLAESRGIGLWLPNADQRVMIPCLNFHIVETTGSIASGASGSAKVLTPASGSLVDTTGPLTLTVNDIGTGATTASGTRCVVVQHMVGGKWWMVPFGTATGGTGSITIIAELSGDLAKTDATKTATVIAGYGAGAPSSGSVTLINPAAKGGNYQYRATASTQYVTAVYTGTDYLIIGVQPVAFDPVDDVTWDGTDLKQVKRDTDVGFLGTTATTTIDSATDCAE